MQKAKLQEAKSRLLEALNAAEAPSQQETTVLGHSVAIVPFLSNVDKFAGTGESLVAFMRRSPLAGDENLDAARDRSLTRAETL